MKNALLVALVMSACTAASATELTLSAGATDGNTLVGVGVRFSERSITAGNFVTLHPEVQLSAVRGDHGTALNLAATPMFRLNFTEKFFSEVGVGVSYFSKRDIGPMLSTNFQFIDNVGIGYKLSPKSTVGLRFTHFSNAGIKKPNPGIDVIQITFSTGF